MNVIASGIFCALGKRAQGSIRGARGNLEFLEASVENSLTVGVCLCMFVCVRVYLQLDITVRPH